LLISVNRSSKGVGGSDDTFLRANLFELSFEKKSKKKSAFFYILLHLMRFWSNTILHGNNKLGGMPKQLFHEFKLFKE